jgi:hypothetical protein
MRSRWLARISHRSRRNLAVAVLLVVACAAFVLSTQNLLGPLNRFRVIMGALLAQSVLLAVLVSRLFELHQELRSQHRAATYVNTVRGLWLVLEEAAADGGIPLATRQRIHKAARQQFELYDEALRLGG